MLFVANAILEFRSGTCPDSRGSALLLETVKSEVTLNAASVAVRRRQEFDDCNECQGAGSQQIVCFLDSLTP